MISNDSVTKSCTITEDPLKINVVVSCPLASYKDKNKHKHQIAGVGFDKVCPNNFKVISTIELESRIWIRLQRHLFMFSDLDDWRLKEIAKILGKLDIMSIHAIKGDDFEHLYFDTYSKLCKFDFVKVRLEIEHDTKHDVLDFRTIYYFIANAVNNNEYY